MEMVRLIENWALLVESKTCVLYWTLQKQKSHRTRSQVQKSGELQPRSALNHSNCQTDAQEFSALEELNSYSTDTTDSMVFCPIGRKTQSSVEQTFSCQIFQLFDWVPYDLVEFDEMDILSWVYWVSGREEDPGCTPLDGMASTADMSLYSIHVLGMATVELPDDVVAPHKSWTGEVETWAEDAFLQLPVHTVIL